jgi:hypothetical protein
MSHLVHPSSCAHLAPPESETAIGNADTVLLARGTGGNSISHVMISVILQYDWPKKKSPWLMAITTWMADEGHRETREAV